MFAVLLPQNVSTCTVEITQYALKGQKLLAQGVPTVQVKMFLGVIKSFHIGFLSYMASLRSL